MRKTLLRALAITLLVLPFGDASANPVKWSGNGHYYDAVSLPAPISWEEADAAARESARSPFAARGGVT